MARRPTWPPKIHHHSSGQARVSYRGEDYYLGPFGSDAAQKAYAELLLRLAEGSPGIPRDHPAHTSAPTVRAACGRFLTAARADRRPDQLRLYRAALQPLLRLCGEMPAAEFSDLELERVRAAMASGSWMDADEKARRRKFGHPIGWCRSVVNGHVRRIRTCWRWAERQKLVPRGSWANLRTLPALRANTPGVREGERRKGTTREALEAVLPWVQYRRRHRPNAVMLLVQFLSGMRSCEVCLMRPCDIDRETGPVIDGIRVWLYRPGKWKTQGKDQAAGRRRVIVLGPEAQAALAPHLLKCGPEEYLFRPLGRPHPYPVPTYAAAVRRACERAGVKLIPYGSRHAMADRVQKAADLNAARAVLGHADEKMTLNYVEPVNVKDVEIAAKIIAKLG